MSPSELKALRASWGISQAQMAKLLRMHEVQVARAEAGISRLPHHMADYLRSLDANPAHRLAMMKERGCV